MRGQGRDHRRAQDVGHVKHDGVRPPPLNKGPQLIFKILWLLPRESWHGISSTKTLPGQPMTRFAICYLSLKLLLRNSDRTAFFRATRCGENDCENCRVQQGL